MATSKGAEKPPPSRTCLCAPTTHPGSFRCHLHRNSNSGPKKSARVSGKYLEMAVMAKAKSLKAFLLQMIKPSSHDLQRRRNFQPKPSRFSLLHNNANSAFSAHHHNHNFHPGVPVS